MKRIVLLQHTSSAFGVLGQMTQDLQDAFSRLGIHAVIHTMDANNLSASVKAIQEMHPDCTWAINTIIGETFFYYPFGIPHVVLSVDSIVHSCPAAFVQPHLVSLYVDKVSCDLFATVSKNPVLWFPHAIAKETIDHLRKSPQIPLRDRSFDVVLIGSFIDHEAEKRFWTAHFAAPDVAAFVHLAEGLLDDPLFILPSETLAYVERSRTVQAVLERLELSPFALAGSIERYARGLDRERLLMALKGRSVHIFTNEKDGIAWSSRPSAKDCIFHPPVPFNAVVDICRNAKVVIQSAPMIHKGYHERLFLAIASGAVALINEGGLLPRSLTKEGRVVEYKSSALDTIVDDLKAAEDRPYDASKILTWLEAEHSWEARLRHGLPEIEKSVAQLHDLWESNPFWRLGRNCL